VTYSKAKSASELFFVEIFTGGMVRAYRATTGARLCETLENRMNIDDSRSRFRWLHHFRFTRLWTVCIRLLGKHL
jgi:hypothetical protein